MYSYSGFDLKQSRYNPNIHYKPTFPLRAPFPNSGHRCWSPRNAGDVHSRQQQWHLPESEECVKTVHSPKMFFKMTRSVHSHLYPGHEPEEHLCVPLVPACPHVSRLQSETEFQCQHRQITFLLYFIRTKI